MSFCLGGPSIYEPKDPSRHDQSWDDFVTPPLLRSLKAPLHDAKTEEVHWLVHEPAYVSLWGSDIGGQKTAPTQYQHAINVKKRFSSYLDLVKRRVAERSWKYQGISSAEDVLAHLKGLKASRISRVWFYGHARDDLWLSLRHDSRDHEAIEPDSKDVLSLSRIGTLKASSFVPHNTAKAPHKFFGCNTKLFAASWAKLFNFYAEGAEGKVDFARIHHNGGMVVLSAGAKWFQYSNAGFPFPLGIKAGVPVG
ncbi:hypothetical protein [Archangium primigenium]|uniref:hypothetical protein n=1 Tax=[Archangium] primigenium TaxID=2792470 RepID=UPI001956FD2F|nr:hypothetical protein [Archangium primigenium]